MKKNIEITIKTLRFLASDLSVNVANKENLLITQETLEYIAEFCFSTNNNAMGIYCTNKAEKIKNLLEIKK